MPSGRKSSRPEPGLVFFLDRGLGRYLVAGMLREAGYEVVTMADAYPDGADQGIGDHPARLAIKLPPRLRKLRRRCWQSYRGDLAG